MTKQELEEEAEDYANKTRIKDKNTYVSFNDECISELQDYEGNYMDISERIIKTYIDSAEPREKQIEIDAEQIRALQKQNGELTDYNKKLLQSDIDKQNKIVLLSKKVNDLQKENAELKVKNKWYSEQVCNKECAEVWGNLTKAKEYIKLLLMNCVGVYESTGKTIAEIQAEAENFLKESEVEKK